MEPYVPPEQEPPRSQRPVRVPGLETPSPRSQSALPDLDTARGAGPMGGFRGPATGDASDAASIRGAIRLGEGADPSAGPDPSEGRDLSRAVVFLIARASEGGPPLAVRRLPPGPFPLDFEIGPAHVMMPGASFRGPVRLQARLDADGDALTREERDLESPLVSGLEPGAAGVELVLERR